MIKPILYTYMAKLDRVIDSNTIALHLDRGFRDYSIKTICLARIDAPKIQANQAKNWVEQELTKATAITIQSLELDNLGRSVAEVWYWEEGNEQWISLNDRLLNKAYLNET